MFGIFVAWTAVDIGGGRVLPLRPDWSGGGDPTGVTVHDHFRFLVVTSGRRPPRRLIRETAHIARRVDAERLILNVHPDPEHLANADRRRKELLAARDVAHEVILVDGDNREQRYSGGGDRRGVHALDRAPWNQYLLSRWEQTVYNELSTEGAPTCLDESDRWN